MSKDLSLGQILAATQQQAEAREKAEKALRVQQQLHEDLKPYRKFFDDAREKFTAVIRAGEIPEPISLDGYDTGIYDMFRAYSYKYNMNLDPNDIRNPVNRLYPAWKEFADWCANCDLEPVVQNNEAYDNEDDDRPYTFFSLGVEPVRKN